MIKCKNDCENETIKFEGCCRVCPDHDYCEFACEKDHSICGDSIPDADNEETALAVFQEQQVTVLNNIAALVKAKKDLEAKEDNLKFQLQKAMETYGIKKFISDILDIT